ncbi:Zn-dependent hydrolase [Thalassobacillus devorans]|uniref:Zn-dependent hydrolase n=1 Tax=Thalassobacillus devorans TaxID=279813 RepID=A0ABQ1NH95_9BACI|nr:M20 family metallo-hydrolase [Thalassobacillus devorans]NIK27374.1 allantoate deiminase/N-carbamoyl-L-amino-acid hydrolase [Thalassobacillus devorans]GGC77204.1 Zn-dependent hydrolase [Thalassobacillus devorans]
MALRQLTINQKRLNDHISELAKIGKIGETGVCRLALSQEYKAGIERVKQWMEDAGLQTRVDHFSNLFGRLEGKNPEAPALLIGSHIDSQPYGGQFDGTIGVLGALEVLQTMQENGIQPDIPIEVVSLCDEEGHRFGKGLFGSRGILGKLDEGELERTDKDGISRREALQSIGCDPDRLQESKYPKDSIAAYLEMHIEQGPLLETADQPVGIVNGISGPLWLTVELSGFAGHAGSVPMNLRNDALLGASKVITALNEIVKQEPEAPTVGTVGNIEVFPNARSVIPEKTKFTIDLRDIDKDRRDRYEHQLRDKIAAVAEENGLDYEIKEDTNNSPRYCDPNIKATLHEEAGNMGLDAPELMSGPFHDALIMADACNYGMIFVRCKDGISHNPKEFAKAEDIAIGTELLLRTVLKMATTK